VVLAQAATSATAKASKVGIFKNQFWYYELSHFLSFHRNSAKGEIAGKMVGGLSPNTKMKSFLSIISIILLSVFSVGTITAFHGTSLVCNKCHTMHYSESGGIPLDGDIGGPFKHLLIKEHSSELCLTCHDGQANTPDVFRDDFNGLTERAAGSFAGVNQINANGHNLGEDKLGPSELPSGGEFNTAKVGCVNCHEPHGMDTNNPNYRYRNLKKAAIVGSQPIIKAFVNPIATGLNVYEQKNIGYAAPTTQTSDWREVTNICLDCHHTFSGYDYTRSPATASGTCIRHPCTESERSVWEPINKHTGSIDPTHWVNGTGIGFAVSRLPFIVSGATNYTEATTVAQNNEVFCLTCHKAHGADNDSSLRWNYLEGSNLGCQQCHNIK